MFTHIHTVGVKEILAPLSPCWHSYAPLPSSTVHSVNGSSSLQKSSPLCTHTYTHIYTHALVSASLSLSLCVCISTPTPPDPALLYTYIRNHIFLSLTHVMTYRHKQTRREEATDRIYICTRACPHTRVCPLVFCRVSPPHTRTE